MANKIPVVISFDVDNTLDISGGVIKKERVIQLKKAGFIVGFNGNYRLAREKLGEGFDFYESGKGVSLEKLNWVYPDAVLKIHVDDDVRMKEVCKKLGWIYIHPEDFI